jgi:hypothetical protein
MAEIMDWLFGKVLTPQGKSVCGYRVSQLEIMKENQNLIRKSIREIERERKKMENQETKLIADMKKTAANGQMVRSPSALCNGTESVGRCEDHGTRSCAHQEARPEDGANEDEAASCFFATTGTNAYTLLYIFAQIPVGTISGRHG